MEIEDRNANGEHRFGPNKHDSSLHKDTGSRFMDEEAPEGTSRESSCRVDPKQLLGRYPSSDLVSNTRYS